MQKTTDELSISRGDFERLQQHPEFLALMKKMDDVEATAEHAIHELEMQVERLIRRLTK